MTNDRLRAALLQRDETLESVAALLGVDPKTVERWVGGRTPYRRYRYQLAARLKMDDAYLWPDASTPEQQARASAAEVINVHANRGAVPDDLWKELFQSAEEEIGILVYTGYFMLVDEPEMTAILRARARAGVRVRILVGDPDSHALQARGREEGIDDTLASRARNVLFMLKPLMKVAGIEVRLHTTTLYNSIYRGDNEMLVNTHAYGIGAARAPVMHLHKVLGGSIVTTYLESFEQVWASGRPLTAKG